MFILIVPIATEKVSRISSLWSYPVEYYLEPVEEYSESKIHMSEPESGKGNVNTVEFVNQAREILESVAWSSLFTMNEHSIANVYLDLIFLLRIMFVKNILLQISCCA